jgi:hypothetical protein
VTAQKKKLFFFALAALPLLARCAQQDAAALVTISGPFNIPAAADKLHIESIAILYEGAAVVGTGETTADFASGRTVEVTLALTSP